MAVPHSEIVLTIAPDDYHIQTVGKSGDGFQLFITTCLHYDKAASSTTDYDVAFKWDRNGNFVNADIVSLGKRGDPKSSELKVKASSLSAKYQDIKKGSISVRPCSVRHDGLIFGLIPRTDDGETFVELMPGNSICFLEPFEGDYDT